ncbi:hypothetical protein ANN_05691 [Periplaneta americana]|uniref:Uncharacterized protein n=1 Tax=Periplaneta americana TaxID=6978 RepID=A0ABQ8TBM0_PERAM|nr:hypothetical protein ANN_05691 [Periplaneta americana]
MRPSSLGPAVKRKFELEEEKDQYLSPPTKRPNCYSVERGGLLMAHSRLVVLMQLLAFLFSNLITGKSG